MYKVTSQRPFHIDGLNQTKALEIPHDITQPHKVKNVTIWTREFSR